MEQNELKPGVIPANFSDEDAALSRRIIVGVLGLSGSLLLVFTIGAILGR